MELFVCKVTGMQKFKTKHGAVHAPVMDTELKVIENIAF